MVYEDTIYYLCCVSQKSDQIKQWIKDHPYFKWSGMCRKLNIAPGNFSRVLQSETFLIPEKQIEVIEPILKDYGFQSNIQVKDLTQPTNVAKPPEQPKTNYSINTLPKETEAGKRPKTLDEIKALCPKGLDQYERAAWIGQERQKYGI